HAILDAADHPDPFLGHLVGGRAGDQKMEGGNDGDIRCIDREHQSDRQQRLDRAGNVHPGRRWIELGGLEEVQRRRLGELADDVRDEEQAADQAQEVYSVGEVEVLEVAGHYAPPFSVTRPLRDLLTTRTPTNSE